MTIVSAEKDTEKVPAVLTCEACGRAFSCGAKIGECWCFAVEVNAESLTAWREKFINCLCEDCLNKTESIQADQM